MGSSLEKPTRAAVVCPLCHLEFRNQITLRCSHSFCQGCIGELWSGCPTGPFFCPECKYEYRKLPDFGEPEGASTSAGVHRSWTLGKRLSACYSTKNVLGKRKFSSPAFRQTTEGYKLGTATSDNSPVNANDSCDLETQQKKKKTSGVTLSGGQKMSSLSDTSTTEATSLANPSKKKVDLISKSSQENSLREENLVEPCCSGIQTSQQELAQPVCTHPKQSSPKARNSSIIPEEQLSSFQAHNDKFNESFKTSDELREGSCSVGSVLCHYCSSQEQRSAVKTCLVCGASMCSEHLRAHLESPVFQSHPLVPAVEDVSPWRCQEHQEINRIYCRPCRICVCTVCTVIGSHKDHTCISIREAEKELRTTLKSEMKKTQKKETAVLNRVTELTERKNSVQEVVDGIQNAVMKRYQAMREALELEEEQALSCVAQEESRVLGSIEQQLGLLNCGLGSIQKTFNALERLADAQGASRAQEQAFIMEYRKITDCLHRLSDPMENLESIEEVNQGRLDCLQDWTERRLHSVIISVPHRDPFRLLYGLSPTLDPDTIHPKLLLSADNRQVEYSEVQQTYLEHEARFTVYPQVLGSKALCQGRHYWEVDVSLDEGRWKVGVCDGLIVRKGQKDSCRIGFYSNSWCLVCEKSKVEALHNKLTSPVCATGLQKVGVLLDFEEGCLSFYSVAEEGSLTLLYSFQHMFSDPLYPALAVSKTKLSICDLFVKSATH